MTALELEKVRSSCRTLREKAMVDFLYSTAARVSEFCDCKRSDVNLIDHTVRIEHGKGDKARTTFINAKSEISLRAYLDSRSDTSESLFVTSCSPYHKMSKRAAVPCPFASRRISSGIPRPPLRCSAGCRSNRSSASSVTPGYKPPCAMRKLLTWTSSSLTSAAFRDYPVMTILGNC